MLFVHDAVSYGLLLLSTPVEVEYKKGKKVSDLSVLVKSRLDRMFRILIYAESNNLFVITLHSYKDVPFAFNIFCS